MDSFDIRIIYWLLALVSSVLAAANGSIEFNIEVSGSFSSFLMVLGSFCLFFLLAQII
ncbi:MAG: hypothetical protein SD837_22110 [Candidatus Electrothrix scaldis]|nr:MAG: hypothetical protein SD837_22110 [Candidatus Electrothrix sp. GW3-3]